MDDPPTLAHPGRRTKKACARTAGSVAPTSPVLCPPAGRRGMRARKEPRSLSLRPHREKAAHDPCLQCLAQASLPVLFRPRTGLALSFAAARCRRSSSQRRCGSLAKEDQTRDICAVAEGAMKLAFVRPPREHRALVG